MEEKNGNEKKTQVDCKKYYCFDCKHTHGIFENHIWGDEEGEN
jgi:hypothetical protein